jgi:hypothetical protein
MKFRYLLIVFLLNFFLTNFIFTKKSLAAGCVSNTDPTADCTDLDITSANINITNNFSLSSTVTSSGATDAALDVTANNATIENNAQIGVGDDRTGVRFSSSTGGVLVNNSGGTISGNNTAGVYISGSTSTATITNFGTIQGTNSAYAIGNEGTLTIVNKSTGTITTNGSYSIINYKSLDLTNNGTISSTDSGGGYSGTVTSENILGGTASLSLVNTGTISASGYELSAVYIGSNTADINNSGTIEALGGASTKGDASGIANYGTINTITNTGTINATTAGGYGIYNRGTITTLNNKQSGLTYYGKLPTNYNIILGSDASTFGTLSVTSPSGSTTFGIDSGTVKASKYIGVITGVSTSYLSATTGTYGGYDWSLGLQSGSSTTWDLLFASYVEGPSSADTNVSLSALASHLKGAINYQNSSLNHSLNYDCSYFGKNNFCMSGGVRNTNTRDNDSQSAVVVAAAKINDQLRVGGYIDKVVSDNFNSNMKLSSNIPILGVFAKHNEHGDFGLKASLSAGYVDQDVKSTRTVSGTSEPGSGTSSLDTKGIQAEIKYGISHSSFLTVSPYVGYQNTLTTRDRYTEQTSSSVTTPLTYNKIKQKEKTAFAGIELKSYFYTTDLFATLNLGYEHTTKFSLDNLSTTGVSGMSDINLGSSVDKNRPLLTASFNKDLNQAGRLSLNFDRRQQAYSPTNSTNVAVQYKVGF